MVSRSAEYHREYYKKNKDKILARHKVYYQNNGVKYLKSRQKSNQKVRQDILEFFGRKCRICGFDDERALQVDHVNGGGGKEYGKGGYLQYAKQITADKTGKYQLLCANCNTIKKVENCENRRTW